MKQKHLFIALAIASFCITSCGEDDCDHEIHTNTASDVVGNWYEEAENEEMRFNESGTFYDRYCNVRHAAETEGRWVYDKDNSKLTYTYSYLGQTQYADWTVKNLTEIGMTISSSTVADHVLERIVESYSMEVGETQTIQFATTYPAYTVQSYKSNNPLLADVSSDGVITAAGEKGTTYIKVVTDKGNVWVRVTVGDDRLDLWYDYASLLGANYTTVRNILGTYSVAGDDGYSYGYSLADLHTYAKQLDVWLDSSTGKVSELALSIKDGVPESEIVSYMNAHYYPYTALGSEYYTTCDSLKNSKAVVRYDKENKCIRFLPTDMFGIPDYTSDFGLTESEIVAKYGELYLGELPYYTVSNNQYVSAVYFSIDETTGKVTAYQLFTVEGADPETIKSLLASKYNMYRSQDNQFAYRDGETMDDSKVMIVYTTTRGTITVFDLQNYGKSSDSEETKAFDYTSDFGLTESEIVAKYGELYRGKLPYYTVSDNQYVSTVYFVIDETTEKVTAYQLTTVEDADTAKIKSLLASKYNMYRSQDDQYAYRDGETQAASKVMIVYNAKEGTITVFDLLNYGKSSSSKKRKRAFDMAID